jgi:hypothetical protein
LYKSETLVPFEVLPLRLDAAIPAPLPMLETLSKIVNGNAVEGRQRFAATAYGRHIIHIYLLYIWFHVVAVIIFFVSIGDPTVHLTSLVIGSVFFEGLKMAR